MCGKNSLFGHKTPFNNCTPPCLGALLQIVGYSMMSPAPPFPALVLGLAVNGIGRPLQVSRLRYSDDYILTKELYFKDSQANAFVACARDNKSLKLGLIHALYGTYVLGRHKSRLEVELEIEFLYIRFGRFQCPFCINQIRTNNGS